MKKVLLGTGPLSWNAMERRTDRYGSVFLSEKSSTEQSLDPCLFEVSEAKKHVGTKGTLVAQVIKNRKSSHIGDLFHGFFPSMPEVGEEIELGTGTLFYELQSSEFHAVGLRPDDGRTEFWLTPQNLYRSHEQTVKLWFIPESND